MKAQGMLKVEISRKDKPTLRMFFESPEQIRIFHEFIEQLIEDVKTTTLAKER